MINNPLLIILLLLSIEIILLRLSHAKRLHKIFNVVPVIFLLFASGMLLSNAGIIDRGSFVYQKSIDWLLPTALFLMMITVDVRSILHLGKAALIVFFAGAVGVMVGMVVAFLAVKGIIGSQYAAGFGALTGSWTGGSANMIAVKEALGVPNNVYTLMVIIDSIIPYVWMGFLIFLCKKQAAIDKYHGAREFQIKDVQVLTTSFNWQVLLPLLAGGIVLSGFLNWISAHLPVIKGIISPFTWVIILVTTIALGIGVTPLGIWARKGLGMWGQWILFFVLICIGTKGDLSQIQTVPWLFLAGIIAVLCHVLILYGVGRLIKAPLFLIAISSQANLGGVASASMLAEIYRPGLAGVGLLMAILGNIIGTYAGIFVGEICRLLS